MRAHLHVRMQVDFSLLDCLALSASAQLLTHPVVGPAGSWAGACTDSSACARV